MSGFRARVPGEADRAKRILLVDDDSGLREVLVCGLGRRGYHVAEAGDGLLALGLCAFFEPDVIVTDLKMPRMTGIGLQQHIAQTYGRQAPPMILMTAEDLTEAPGFVRIVHKPVTPSVIIDAVVRALSDEALAHVG